MTPLVTEVLMLPTGGTCLPELGVCCTVACRTKLLDFVCDSVQHDCPGHPLETADDKERVVTALKGFLCLPGQVSQHNQRRGHDVHRASLCRNDDTATDAQTPHSRRIVSYKVLVHRRILTTTFRYFWVKTGIRNFRKPRNECSTKFLLAQAL